MGFEPMTLELAGVSGVLYNHLIGHVDLHLVSDPLLPGLVQLTLVHQDLVPGDHR